MIERASIDTEVGPDDRRAVAGLSDRQIACLEYAGDGLSSKEIGRLLGIAPSTVDNHIHVAVAKLNVKNRWQAAQLLQREPLQNGAKSAALLPLVPPLGGRANHLNARARLLQIGVVAIISIIALTSFIVLVLGAVAVFDLG